MTQRTTTRDEWIEEALRRFERPLVRHALRFTGDIEQARDVVQDVFLRLCRADREQVEGHLAAWLYTVCRNRALDIVRKEGRMGPLNPERMAADPDPGGGPGAAAAQRQEIGLVLEAVRGLSEEQQQAFRLKFQDDLTYREIGQVMDKSLGSVSRLITSALATIRDHLRRHVELVGEG